MSQMKPWFFDFKMMVLDPSDGGLPGTKRAWSLLGGVWLMLASYCGTSLPLQAGDNIPPFVAEGHLSTQEIRTERTNLSYRTEAKVLFYYSNGWWQVQAEYSYLHQKGSAAHIDNCMRIPDGTRTYTLFGGDGRKGVTGASACPNPFPPPGNTELLATWLSLCPRPELPLIDAQRMRRFINLTICRPDIFDRPWNEGNYGLQYLSPGEAFLSELNITNNGFSIELTVAASGNPEGEVTRFRAPFNNGFQELEYRVLESTNFNGIAFPMRMIYKRFSPDFLGKRREDVRVRLVSELVVSRISFSKDDIAKRSPAPSPLFAFDLRAPDLPKYATVDYLVTGDEWKPLSDPEIARRVRGARQSALER